MSRPTYDLTTHPTPTADLRPHPRNPRNGDTDAIAASLQVNGQYRPIVVARGGVILAGNHTYAAAMELGWPTIDAVHIDVDPDSQDAVRIMLADNRTADLGRYDDGLLLALLDDLDVLDGTGYVLDDLEGLRAIVDEALDLEDDADRDESGRGALLNIADLSYGEPKHPVERLDRRLVGHHILHVCDPHLEWERFWKDLQPGMIFAPYPEPYLTLSDTARQTPMLLVQPSVRLAGHLLDKHAAAFGEQDLA